MKKNISFEKKITFPTMIGEISAIDLEHNLKFIDESNVEGEFIVKGKYKLTEASRLEEDFEYKIPTEIVLTEKLDLVTTNIEIVDFYYEIENDDTMICFIEIKIEGLEKIELEDDSVRNQDLEFLEDRECDGDIKTEEEKEIPHKDNDKMDVEKIEEVKEVEFKDLEKINEKEEKLEEMRSEEEIFNNGNGEENMKKDEMNEEIQEEVEMEETKEEETESLSNIFSSLSEKEETFATYSVYILREEETINTVIEKYKTTKEELEKYNDLNSLTKGSKIIVPILSND